MVTAKIEKNVFIEKLEKGIESMNRLVFFAEEVYFPTIEKFKGKVYNIRFIKALREKVCNIEFIFIKELYYKTIEVRASRSIYCDPIEDCIFYFPLPLTEEKRIVYDPNDVLKTISEIEDKIKEYQSIIMNYGQYIAIAEQLDTIAERYLKLPSIFRESINTVSRFVQ